MQEGFLSDHILALGLKLLKGLLVPSEPCAARPLSPVLAALQLPEHQHGLTLGTGFELKGASQSVLGCPFALLRFLVFLSPLRLQSFPLFLFSEQRFSPLLSHSYPWSY